MKTSEYGLLALAGNPQPQKMTVMPGYTISRQTN
jgi:hypothetical protein